MSLQHISLTSYAAAHLTHISLCSTSHPAAHLSLCSTSFSHLTLQHISLCSTSLSAAHLSHISHCSTSHSVAHLSLQHISRCSTSHSVAHLSLQHISRCSTSHAATHSHVAPELRKKGRERSRLSYAVRLCQRTKCFKIIGLLHRGVARVLGKSNPSQSTCRKPQNWAHHL